MFKKLLILLLALILCISTLAFTVLAADGDGSELVLIFEENFEEYEKDVNVSSTTMPNFFVADYNAIGDGVISVQEANTGNLYLFSHVFTQIYSATPIVGAYEFSLDVLEAQGKVQTGIFIRAPKTAAAFYEEDGHPDTSVCQAGLFLYPRGSALGVNIKTYDEKAAGTAYLQNNTVEFPLPAGAAYPYNVRVTDSGSEIVIYVNDTLICRIAFSEPGQVYGSHESEGKFYGAAKLYDAEGNEKGSYTDPLLSSDGSYIGWTTRASNMSVDNVRVLVNKSHQTLLAINQLPTKVTDKNLEDSKELAAAARALYDALTEEEKSLVINFSKLTKAEEAIIELEAVTTEEITEAPTTPVTQEPTTAPIEDPTDEATNPPDDIPTEPESVTLQTPAATDEGDVTEVKVIDDSLAVWILIAVMIVAVCGTAGFITVRVRK